MLAFSYYSCIHMYCIMSGGVCVSPCVAVFVISTSRPSGTIKVLESWMLNLNSKLYSALVNPGCFLKVLAWLDPTTARLHALGVTWGWPRAAVRCGSSLGAGSWRSRPRSGRRSSVVQACSPSSQTAAGAKSSEHDLFYLEPAPNERPVSANALSNSLLLLKHLTTAHVSSTGQVNCSTVMKEVTVMGQGQSCGPVVGVPQGSILGSLENTNSAIELIRWSVTKCLIGYRLFPIGPDK